MARPAYRLPSSAKAPGPGCSSSRSTPSGASRVLLADEGRVVLVPRGGVGMHVHAPLQHERMPRLLPALLRRQAASRVQTVDRGRQSVVLRLERAVDNGSETTRDTARVREPRGGPCHVARDQEHRIGGPPVARRRNTLERQRLPGGRVERAERGLYGVPRARRSRSRRSCRYLHPLERREHARLDMTARLVHPRKVANRVAGRIGADQVAIPVGEELRLHRLDVAVVSIRGRLLDVQPIQQTEQLRRQRHGRIVGLLDG